MDTTGSRSRRSESSALRRYVIAAPALSAILMGAAVATGAPTEPVVLLATFGVLLGGAVLTARSMDGGGARTLFSGALRWRIGWGAWAVAGLALPVTTVGVAAATGTLIPPPDGWLGMLLDYGIATLLVGTLIVNLWEEAAWTGLVQRGLSRRYGPLAAALLTAVPFAVVHLPLAFADGATPTQAMGTAVVIIVFAPALRVVLGRLDRSTGGSLLAVGVMHASFNASGALDVLVGGWQHVMALVIVAAVGSLVRRGKPQHRRDEPAHGVTRDGYGCGPNSEAAAPSVRSLRNTGQLSRR